MANDLVFTAGLDNSDLKRGSTEAEQIIDRWVAEATATIEGAAGSIPVEVIGVGEANEELSQLRNRLADIATQITELSAGGLDGESLSGYRRELESAKTDYDALIALNSRLAQEVENLRGPVVVTPRQETFSVKSDDTDDIASRVKQIEDAFGPTNTAVVQFEQGLEASKRQAEAVAAASRVLGQDFGSAEEALDAVNAKLEEGTNESDRFSVNLSSILSGISAAGLAAGLASVVSQLQEAARIDFTGIESARRERELNRLLEQRAEVNQRLIQDAENKPSLNDEIAELEKLLEIEKERLNTAQTFVNTVRDRVGQETFIGETEGIDDFNTLRGNARREREQARESVENVQERIDELKESGDDALTGFNQALAVTKLELEGNTEAARRLELQNQKTYSPEQIEQVIKGERELREIRERQDNQKLEKRIELLGLQAELLRANNAEERELVSQQIDRANATQENRSPEQVDQVVQAQAEVRAAREAAEVRKESRRDAERFEERLAAQRERNAESEARVSERRGRLQRRQERERENLNRPIGGVDSSLQAAISRIQEASNAPNPLNELAERHHQENRAFEMKAATVRERQAKALEKILEKKPTEPAFALR